MYVVFSVQCSVDKDFIHKWNSEGKKVDWFYGKDYSFWTPGTWSVIREKKLLKTKYFSGWNFKYKTVPNFHPPHISLQGSRHVAVWSDTKCHGRSRLDPMPPYLWRTQSKTSYVCKKYGWDDSGSGHLCIVLHNSRVSF